MIAGDYTAWLIQRADKAQQFLIYRNGLFTWTENAALIIGLVNATLGLFLKIITLPLTILTLGIFWWVINALMLMFASAILRPSFEVSGFWPAFLGAIVLSLVNMVLRAIARDVERA